MGDWIVRAWRKITAWFKELPQTIGRAFKSGRKPRFINVEQVLNSHLGNEVSIIKRHLAAINKPMKPDGELEPNDWKYLQEAEGEERVRGVWDRTKKELEEMILGDSGGELKGKKFKDIQIMQVENEKAHDLSTKVGREGFEELKADLKTGATATGDIKIKYKEGGIVYELLLPDESGLVGKSMLKTMPPEIR